MCFKTYPSTTGMPFLKAANFIAEVGYERLFLGCIFYEVKTVRRVIFKCHVDIDLTQ